MRNKYGARRVVTEDGAFDSRAELRRFEELRLMEVAGVIGDLERQVPFDLVVCGTKVARYIADFVYLQDGEQVVEDVKGVRTPVFVLKKKLLRAIYGIEVREIR